METCQICLEGHIVYGISKAEEKCDQCGARPAKTARVAGFFSVSVFVSLSLAVLFAYLYSSYSTILGWAVLFCLFGTGLYTVRARKVNCPYCEETVLFRSGSEFKARCPKCKHGFQQREYKNGQFTKLLVGHATRCKECFREAMGRDPENASFV